MPARLQDGGSSPRKTGERAVLAKVASGIQGDDGKSDENERSDCCLELHLEMHLVVEPMIEDKKRVKRRLVCCCCFLRRFGPISFDVSQEV